MSFPQLGEQHVHRLPNSVEPVIIQIGDRLVLTVIEQGKNTLAIRAASLSSIRPAAIPGNKEKWDVERIQKIGREA